MNRRMFLKILMFAPIAGLLARVMKPKEDNTVQDRTVWTKVEGSPTIYVDSGYNEAGVWICDDNIIPGRASAEAARFVIDDNSIPNMDKLRNWEAKHDLDNDARNWRIVPIKDYIKMRETNAKA